MLHEMTFSVDYGLPQIALVNDCLYSAMDSFTWISSHDLDEYIFTPATNKTLASILDEYEEQPQVGALLIKSWVHDAKDEPWKVKAGRDLPWGVRKHSNLGTHLGVDSEMLTIKQKKFRHARATEIRYGKWYARPASTESGGTHFVYPRKGTRLEIVPETVLHFKHFYNLCSNRTINCEDPLRQIGWCTQGGEPESELDTAAFDRHGTAFLQLWPYHFPTKLHRCAAQAKKIAVACT